MDSEALEIHGGIWQTTTDLSTRGESSNRELAQVFQSELTDRQLQILELIGLHPAIYARENNQRKLPGHPAPEALKARRMSVAKQDTPGLVPPLGIGQGRAALIRGLVSGY